jgi:hypothetical protein
MAPAPSMTPLASAARLAVVALLLVWPSLATAQVSAKWNTYTNERFGFRFSHPASLKPSRAPENGAGLNFSDGRMSVTVQAHYSFTSIDEIWRDLVAQYGGSATYKVKKKSWFVISGVLPNGTEFYRKFHEGNGSWCELWATYPHALNKTYDPVIERMVKSFVPFLPGDGYDRAPAR